MKITAIEAACYLIPVELPGFPEPEMSDCFVCHIHTDEGISGRRWSRRSRRESRSCAGCS